MGKWLAANMGPAAWPNPWRSSQLSSARCRRRPPFPCRPASVSRAAARSPADGLSSPRVPLTSRLIRSVTLPIAPPAARAMQSPRRRATREQRRSWSAARPLWLIRPGSRSSRSRRRARCATRRLRRCRPTSSSQRRQSPTGGSRTPHGNRSSGRQGHAIAEAARAAGAETILVSGPTALADPLGVKVVKVETAREMRDATIAALPADVFVAAAAVADWRVEDAAKRRSRSAPAARRSCA